MKNKILKKMTFGLFALLLLSNCKGTKTPKEPLLVSADTTWHTTYQGTLPCADCPGIKTTLTLHWTKVNAGKNTYTLTEEYLDRGSFSSSGEFNTERGFGDDNDATVIILNWDKPSENRRYYVYFSKNPKVLHVLNPQKELNKSNLNYTLEQQD